MSVALRLNGIPTVGGPITPDERRAAEAELDRAVQPVPRRAKQMRTVHEDTRGRSAYPEEMTDETYYYITVPAGQAKRVSKQVRKGYELAPGHEANDDEQVVMRIRRDVRDRSQRQAEANCRKFVEVNVGQFDDPSLEENKVTRSRPMTGDQLYHALPEEEEEDDVISDNG